MSGLEKIGIRELQGTQGPNRAGATSDGIDYYSAVNMQVGNGQPSEYDAVNGMSQAADDGIRQAKKLGFSDEELSKLTPQQILKALDSDNPKAAISEALERAADSASAVPEQPQTPTIPKVPTTTAMPNSDDENHDEEYNRSMEDAQRAREDGSNAEKTANEAQNTAKINYTDNISDTPQEETPGTIENNVAAEEGGAISFLDGAIVVQNTSELTEDQKQQIIETNDEKIGQLAEDITKANGLMGDSGDAPQGLLATQDTYNTAKDGVSNSETDVSVNETNKVNAEDKVDTTESAKVAKENDIDQIKGQIQQISQVVQTMSQSVKAISATGKGLVSIGEKMVATGSATPPNPGLVSAGKSLITQGKALINEAKTLEQQLKGVEEVLKRTEQAQAIAEGDLSVLKGLAEEALGELSKADQSLDKAMQTYETAQNTLSSVEAAKNGDIAGFVSAADSTMNSIKEYNNALKNTKDGENVSLTVKNETFTAKTPGIDASAGNPTGGNTGGQQNAAGSQANANGNTNGNNGGNNGNGGNTASGHTPPSSTPSAPSTPAGGNVQSVPTQTTPNSSAPKTTSNVPSTETSAPVSGDKPASSTNNTTGDKKTNGNKDNGFSLKDIKDGVNMLKGAAGIFKGFDSLANGNLKGLDGILKGLDPFNTDTAQGAGDSQQYTQEEIAAAKKYLQNGNIENPTQGQIKIVIDAAKQGQIEVDGIEPDNGT